MMTNDEQRYDKITKAIELIEQAQSLVDAAVIGTDDWDSYLTYGRYGFDQLLGKGNCYDASLETLLGSLS